MKYRPQRGGLKESMAEAVEIEPTIYALAELLKVSPANLTVERYCYDWRIDWDTHIVSIDGKAVGFTDGAVP